MYNIFPKNQFPSFYKKFQKLINLITLNNLKIK